MKPFIFSSLSFFLFIYSFQPFQSLYPPANIQSSTSWQDSAVGLSVGQNTQKNTGGLGYIVNASNWPSLSTQGGVYGITSTTIGGPVGINLGQIKVPGSLSANLTNEDVDWAHNRMTFTTNNGLQLIVTVSRLTPAILINNYTNKIQLMGGSVPGYKATGTSVSNLGNTPSFIKYIAYMSSSGLRIETLSSQTKSITPTQNWMLIWYGNNSVIADSKAPLTYSKNEFEVAKMPATYAFQADIPQLLVFQNVPISAQQGTDGGIELSFSQQMGNLALLPLTGRDHLLASTTESWNSGLPSTISQASQWWAQRLCKYPEKVSETSSYDNNTGSISYTESFQFQNVCSGGTAYAPIPPFLGLVKDTLNVKFSGAVINSGMNTEFGPIWGIDNAQSFTWTLDGIKEQIDAKRIFLNGTMPVEITTLLTDEINKLIQSGHMAPWIFSDTVPRSYQRGDIYWLNPADSLTQLIEIADAFPAGTVDQNFINYIRSERTQYPPEDIFNLTLGEGTTRPGFSLSGQNIYTIWQTVRPEVFLKKVPLYNFYSLSRYYELTSDPIPPELWQKAQTTFAQDISETDWATGYWFKGFGDRRIAVQNENWHYAGALGFVRLAQKMGDNQGEQDGAAMLGRAAITRLAMALYPNYLERSGLQKLPSLPDWQVRYTAGDWFGIIFNYNWTNYRDDMRQVVSLSQFGVSLFDHSGFMEPGSGFTFWNDVTSSSLSVFRDTVPELYHYLAKVPSSNIQDYVVKYQIAFPQWYVAFAEGTLGQEHNLTHPVDSYEIFVAKAISLQATGQELMKYVDIPWLQTGDLFYMNKLAEVLKAYTGNIWNDSLTLNYVTANKAIHLSWEPLEVTPDGTWQIEYIGPAGSPASPINNIPISINAYTIMNLTNYANYFIKLNLISQGQVILHSELLEIIPTDHFQYLPMVNSQH